ncbi:Glutathione transferase [Bertholletia excelsa]
MADEIVLLDFWLSPFAMRVRIALAEKGLEYESRAENVLNSSDLLFEMNPVQKQIPVLIHKSKPICESLIIVEYIDEVWKNKSPFLPCDPHQRAQARFWADFVEKKVYSLGRKMLASTGEAQEAAKKELISCFKLLEGELGEKPYFGGESFGLVDLALIPSYCWSLCFEECGMNMAGEFPKIFAWAERCMDRESVAKSVPDRHRVYAFLVELRKRLSAEH